MTEEQPNLRALLREARDHMHHPFALSGLGFTDLRTRIDAALAEHADSATVIVEPEPPLALRKGDKVEVRVTRAEDVPPVTFSIGDPPLEVDPPEVWVLRFCDLVGIDGTTEEKRLEAFVLLYDRVKAARGMR